MMKSALGEGEADGDGAGAGEEEGVLTAHPHRAIWLVMSTTADPGRRMSWTPRVENRRVPAEQEEYAGAWGWLFALTASAPV